MKRKTVQIIMQSIYLSGKGTLGYLYANHYFKDVNFRFLNLDIINNSLDNQLLFLGNRYQNCSSMIQLDPENISDSLIELIMDHEQELDPDPDNKTIVIYLGEYESYQFLKAIQEHSWAEKSKEKFPGYEFSYEIPIAGSTESVPANNFLRQLVALNENEKRLQINVYLDKSSYLKTKESDQLTTVLQNILKPIQELKFINNIFLYNGGRSNETYSMTINYKRLDGETPKNEGKEGYVTNLFLNKEIGYINEPIDPDNPIPMRQIEDINTQFPGLNIS